MFAGIKIMMEENKMVKDEKKQYSFLIGIWKAIKNLLWTGLPFLAGFLTSLQQSLSGKWSLFLGAVCAFICYLIKNKIDFERRK